MTHELDDVLKALENPDQEGKDYCLFKVSRLSNLRKTLRAFIERDKWHPISEAPKDGTIVLIMDDAIDHSGCMYVASYGKNSRWWNIEAYGNSYIPKATHFKYLPAPPIEGE